MNMMNHCALAAFALAGLTASARQATQADWQAFEHALANNDPAAYTAAAQQTGLDAPLADADNLTPLLFLIQYYPCKTDFIRALLAAGANPNAASEGVIPLCQAATQTKEDIVGLLLQAGARPNSEDGFSPALFSAIKGDWPGVRTGAAWQAAEQRRVSIIRKLVAAGADVNARNKEGESPLSAAVAANQAQAGHALLDMGAKPLAADDPNAHCIFRAARSLDKQDMALCVRAGLSPNARNKEGETPFFEAARRADAAFLRYMLSLGIPLDDSSTSPLRPTPLFCALSNEEPESRQLEAFQVLLGSAWRGLLNKQRHSSGDSVLMLAAAKNRPQIVRLLLERGANIHAKNLSGESALMQAIETGAVPCVELLLQHGARADEADNQAISPMSHAASLQDPEKALAIMRMLMERGLEPDEEVLFSAAIQGAPETVLFLLGKGFSPNAAFASSGNTLLHVASPACAKILIQAGADPNKPNIAGNTPLHFAAGDLSPQRSAERTRVLLEGGANPAVINNYGLAPINKAHGETARLLREALANPAPQP